MSSGASTSERPRRTVRKPPASKDEPLLASSSSQSKQRKDRKPSGGLQLDHLLTHSKSKLTTADISDILNYENFLGLPEEAQHGLCALLPPPAFVTFLPSLDTSHPAVRCRRDKSESSTQQQREEDGVYSVHRSPATLELSVFNNSFFLSGAKTFQDHLFSGWLSKGGKDAVAQYERGVADGSVHAEWKDELWAREHTPAKRGRSTVIDCDLANLAKRSLLQKGDVIVYRRLFSSVGICVEKELLVYSINPLSHAIDLLLQPGEIASLPKDLLIADPAPPQPPTLTMEGIMNAAELEEGVLEVTGQISQEVLAAANNVSDGRISGWGGVTSGSQPSAAATRAGKAVSIWRWREEARADVELQLGLDKGGRDRVGTVHYLSRCPRI